MSREIKRVLIHPLWNIDIGVANQVWELWREIGKTHIVNHLDFDGLQDLSYLKMVNDLLVVGGQATDCCVLEHLKALAENSRVRSGEIRLALSQPAIVPSADFVVQPIVKTIMDDYGVQVLLGMYLR